MTITVNRRKVEFVENESVNRLLKRMRYTFPMVIVRINGEVITRDRYFEVTIPDGADVDVFHIESGG